MFSSHNQIQKLISLPGFQIDEIQKTEGQLIIIRAHSLSESATCPACLTTSDRVHSTYLRTPQTLPILGMQTQLYLTVNRYFCDEENCFKRTFGEQIEQVVPRYGRRSAELNFVLSGLSFETSAESVARICSRLRIKISADSVLRLLRSTMIPPPTTIRVLGVDDWAFKKGHQYGTILVDLENHRPIELLPDRSADTLAAWLAAHPGVKIIARDRSKEYRAGIETGAPSAIQVADRWHLMNNLRERVHSTLPEALKTIKNGALETQPKTAAAQKRQKYFEMVRYLYATGYSQRAIARALGIHRRTVRSYIERETPPDYHKGVPRPSKIDRYESYLRKRWAEGCHDATKLWKEIQSLGYEGKRNSVYRYLRRFRKGQQYHSVRQLTWMFMRAPGKLLDEEQSLLQQLFMQSKEIEKFYHLVQQFVQMIQGKQADELDSWIHQAKQSSFRSVRNFAAGLEEDYEAVKNALRYPWSSGQTEGQVTRLKMIKRQMYGRANFDLLRIRILGPP